jgi:hypothetical protein
MLKYTLGLCLLLALPGCTHRTAPDVRVESRTTATGGQYTIFYSENLTVQATTTRPDPARADSWLSVAAAYTDLTTYEPLDLLVCQGRVRQRQATVGFLDGQLTILGDSLRIDQLPRGQSPAGAQLEQARQQGGTVLLQELLVVGGKNLRSAGGSLFQRRALAELAGHRFAVVESEADDLSMQQFGDDLVELGARSALYLDMGGWDEGWYKDGGRVVKLGHRRTDTARQSNWLVFGSPAAARP